ncbi:MAG: flippase-like domain-containing protein [Bacteroidia bacterium]|nr:flippase-like domain-containing protein [Bacteroidia bacterium]
MKKTLINIAKYLLALAFGILLLYLAMRNLTWEEVKEAFVSAHWGWLVLSMAIGAFSHYIRAVRWGMQYRAFGYNPKNLRLYAAVMLGYLVNQAIPRGGEVARCSILIKSDKIPMAKSLGSVAIERVFDVLILLSLIVLAFFLEHGALEQLLNETLFAERESEGGIPLLPIALGLGVVGLAVFLIFKKRLLQIPIVKKLYDAFLDLYRSALSIKDIENPILYIVYTIAIWVCYILMTYVAFYGMDEVMAIENINLLYFGAIVTIIGGIGMALPSPGGVGTYHISVAITFGAMMVLGTYDASYNLGILFATVMHITQLIMMISIGTWGYVYLTTIVPEVDSAIEKTPVEAEKTIQD